MRLNTGAGVAMVDAVGDEVAVALELHARLGVPAASEGSTKPVHDAHAGRVQRRLEVACPPASGWSSVNSRSYRRNSAGSASCAPTQVMVPLTLTASAPGVPLWCRAARAPARRRRGRRRPCCSRCTRRSRRTSAAPCCRGTRRKKPLAGTSAKSSRSIHSAGPRLKRRRPSSGRCGCDRRAAGLAGRAAEDLAPVGQLELQRVEHGHRARAPWPSRSSRSAMSRLA